MTASGITWAPRTVWRRPAPVSPRTASSGDAAHRAAQHLHDIARPAVSRNAGAGPPGADRRRPADAAAHDRAAADPAGGAVAARGVPAPDRSGQRSRSATPLAAAASD